MCNGPSIKEYFKFSYLNIFQPYLNVNALRISICCWMLDRMSMSLIITIIFALWAFKIAHLPTFLYFISQFTSNHHFQPPKCASIACIASTYLGAMCQLNFILLITDTLNNTHILEIGDVNQDQTTRKLAQRYWQNCRQNWKLNWNRFF